MLRGRRILVGLRAVASAAALVTTLVLLLRDGWSVDPRASLALLAGAGALWLAYLPLEFALVVLVAATSGCLGQAALVPAADATLGASVGLVVASLVAGLRLEDFRASGSPWPRRACVLAGAALALASVLAPEHLPAIAPALLAGLLLAPLGADILLFQQGRRGTPSLRHLLGGLAILVYLLAAQLVLFGLVLPLAWIARRGMGPVRARCSAGMRFMFDAFPYGRLERRGVAREAFARPAVIVSNHQSSVDIPLILSLPADVRILVSQRVWRTPVLGIGARLLSHVLVQRDAPEVTLGRCRGRLEAGASVHAFPEGTRSQGAFPARFHRGPFEIACELEADVLPVVLHNTRSCVPRDAFWVGDFRMRVEALPRITPQDFDYGAGSRALMLEAQRRVREAVVRGHRELHADPGYLRSLVLEAFRYQGREVRRAVERELADWEQLEDWREHLRDAAEVLVVEDGNGVGAQLVSLPELRTRVVGWLPSAARARVARRAAAGNERLEFVHGDEPPLEPAHLAAVVFGPGLGPESVGEWLGDLPEDCRVLRVGAQETGEPRGARA